MERQCCSVALSTASVPQSGECQSGPKHLSNNNENETLKALEVWQNLRITKF